MCKLEPHYSKGEALALARIVVEDVLHSTLARVMADIDSFDDKQLELIDNAIQRLLNDEPIQYITGKTLFHGNEIKVTEAVLIPRPETETLVDITCHLPLERGCHVIDACTGSGCIAISIAKECPQWEVEACDISEEALDIARINAKANSVDITFHNQDILSTELLKGPYDAIVSNPPYVMQRERQDMEAHVLNHEPGIALFVEDDNPLIYYKALADWSQFSLKPNGFLLVEINALLSNETAGVFLQAGYEDVEVIKDIFGKNRFIKCRQVNRAH